MLSEQEAEFDHDTRWALAWFEQYGMKEAAYGDAETLSRAKNTSVRGLVEAGIIRSKGGKVRLLKTEEMLEDWDPATDKRLTVWEVAHYLIQSLNTKGETGAAKLLKRIGPLGESGRNLSYRLYQVCDKKGWAKDALGYNSLAKAWPEIARLAAKEEKAQKGLY